MPLATGDLARMETVGVLYNAVCNEEAAAFSAEFQNEWCRQTGRRWPQPPLDGPRADTTAVRLFQEKGSEWSSGPGCILELREIPRIFERFWEIENEYGGEYVRVDTARIMADLLETFMETGDRESLGRQYAAVKEAQKWLLGQDQSSDNVKPASADVQKDGCINDCGYSYFGVPSESHSGCA